MSDMKTFTVRDLDRSPSVVLDASRADGRVRIRERGGQTYIITQRQHLKSASLRFQAFQPGEANYSMECCLRRPFVSWTKLLPANEALRRYKFLHASLSFAAGKRSGDRLVHMAKSGGASLLPVTWLHRMEWPMLLSFLFGWAGRVGTRVCLLKRCCRSSEFQGRPGSRNVHRRRNDRDLGPTGDVR